VHLPLYFLDATKLVRVVSSCLEGMGTPKLEVLEEGSTEFERRRLQLIWASEARVLFFAERHRLNRPTALRCSSTVLLS
jgi:hypothetical protein